MSVYTLRIPLAERPLLANAAHNLHHHARSSRRKEYRQLAWAHALSPRIPRLDPLGSLVEVRAHYRGGNLPDPMGLEPTAKGMIDGLVDAGVFTDDALVEVLYRRPVISDWMGIELIITAEPVPHLGAQAADLIRRGVMIDPKADR